MYHVYINKLNMKYTLLVYLNIYIIKLLREIYIAYNTYINKLTMK